MTKPGSSDSSGKKACQKSFGTPSADWLRTNIDQRAELVLSEKDERELLRILAEDEFLPLDKVKKELGL